MRARRETSGRRAAWLLLAGVLVNCGGRSEHTSDEDDSAGSAGVGGRRTGATGAAGGKSVDDGRLAGGFAGWGGMGSVFGTGANAGAATADGGPTVCGDGVVGAGEQCDLGEHNDDDDNYGGCTTACALGPYCGDGVVQRLLNPTTGARLEECDDGNTAPHDGCANCQFVRPAE